MNRDDDMPGTIMWAENQRLRAEAERLRNDLTAVQTHLAMTRQIATEKANEVDLLRAGIAEVIEDWREQATADENGWSYRRGNNTFNEGAASVLRHTLPELEAILRTTSATSLSENDPLAHLPNGGTKS